MPFRHSDTIPITFQLSPSLVDEVVDDRVETEDDEDGYEDVVDCLDVVDL